MSSSLESLFTGSELLLILEALCYLHDVKKEAFETASAAGMKIKGRELTEADFGIAEIQSLLKKFNDV
ncbi:hypothetical protein FRC97_00200 (plasmid) [Paracidovorax citrulli]|uniref:hypothetical protein n=1 Tax=Paracidovorax citrulli TaxID=80869 RepID=UPI0006646563|nr:hypothetical protein [Paracidovorax citrulli]QCX13182.1 hypothetical protein APS58_p00038 [Paracidovorax citrulli]UMT93557.1 hypothetical protein FRC97_00200 [Paracidovorax citrulli]